MQRVLIYSLLLIGGMGLSQLALVDALLVILVNMSVGIDDFGILHE